MTKHRYRIWADTNEADGGRCSNIIKAVGLASAIEQCRARYIGSRYIAWHAERI